jgi:hypothetical protein
MNEIPKELCITIDDYLLYLKNHPEDKKELYEHMRIFLASSNFDGNLYHKSFYQLTEYLRIYPEDRIDMKETYKKLFINCASLDYNIENRITNYLDIFPEDKDKFGKNLETISKLTSIFELMKNDYKSGIGIEAKFINEIYKIILDPNIKKKQKNNLYEICKEEERSAGCNDFRYYQYLSIYPEDKYEMEKKILDAGINYIINCSCNFNYCVDILREYLKIYPENNKNIKERILYEIQKLNKKRRLDEICIFYMIYIKLYPEEKEEIKNKMDNENIINIYIFDDNYDSEILQIYFETYPEDKILLKNKILKKCVHLSYYISYFKIYPEDKILLKNKLLKKCDSLSDYISYLEIYPEDKKDLKNTMMNSINDKKRHEGWSEPWKRSQLLKDYKHYLIIYPEEKIKLRETIKKITEESFVGFNPFYDLSVHISYLEIYPEDKKNNTIDIIKKILFSSKIQYKIEEYIFSFVDNFTELRKLIFEFLKTEIINKTIYFYDFSVFSVYLTLIPEEREKWKKTITTYCTKLSDYKTYFKIYPEDKEKLKKEIEKKYCYVISNYNDFFRIYPEDKEKLKKEIEKKYCSDISNYYWFFKIYPEDKEKQKTKLLLLCKTVDDMLKFIEIYTDETENLKDYIFDKCNIKDEYKKVFDFYCDYYKYKIDNEEDE